MKIAEIVQIIRSSGNSPLPCSSVEIANVERLSDYSMPGCYLEFLSVMGKGAGEYMLGSSCFYDEIFDLSDGAKEIIGDNELPALPDKAFVFWMHQGYQFAFFLNDGQYNPPVYFFSEGQGMREYKLIASTLTDFFYMQIKNSGISDSAT